MDEKPIGVPPEGSLPDFEEEPLTGPEEGLPERLTPPRVIVRFFVVPLLLVLAVLGIYVLLGWLLGTQKTPEDLLKDLRSTYPSTREHALYDLSYILQTRPELRRDDRFLQALVEQFRRRHELRPEVRVYLVLALGRLARPESLNVLKEGLEDPDPRIVFYTIWAIGQVGRPEAGAWLVPFTEHPDDGIREMATYALGSLRYAPAHDSLVRRLDDTNPSVRMNAVLALAQLRAPEALSGLRQLSQRAYLMQWPGMDAAKAEAILLNVLRVADAYGTDAELRRNVERLARSDESLKVRHAALEWLRKTGQ